MPSDTVMFPTAFHFWNNLYLYFECGSCTVNIECYMELARWPQTYCPTHLTFEPTPSGPGWHFSVQKEVLVKTATFSLSLSPHESNLLSKVNLSQPIYLTSQTTTHSGNILKHVFSVFFEHRNGRTNCYLVFSHICPLVLGRLHIYVYRPAIWPYIPLIVLYMEHKRKSINAAYYVALTTSLYLIAVCKKKQKKTSHSLNSTRMSDDALLKCLSNQIQVLLSQRNIYVIARIGFGFPNSNI